MAALLGVTGCGGGSTPQRSTTDPAAGSASSASESPAPTSEASASAEGPPGSEVGKKRLVEEAERLALTELPKIPLWKGTKAKGHYVSDTEVCVDRTFRTKPSFADTQNAGFVVVRFPEGSVGEPQDGKCQTEGSVPKPTQEPVDVPEDLQDDPGLLVSTDFGDEWPLKVPYGVVTCEDGAVIFRAPDGTRYAVNGTAQTRTTLPDFDSIWKANSDVKGLKMDIGPVIDRGLELC